MRADLDVDPLSIASNRFASISHEEDARLLEAIDLLHSPTAFRAWNQTWLLLVGCRQGR